MSDATEDMKSRVDLVDAVPNFLSSFRIYPKSPFDATVLCPSPQTGPDLIQPTLNTLRKKRDAVSAMIATIGPSTLQVQAEAKPEGQARLTFYNAVAIEHILVGECSLYLRGQTSEKVCQIPLSRKGRALSLAEILEDAGLCCGKFNDHVKAHHAEAKSAGKRLSKRYISNTCRKASFDLCSIRIPLLLASTQISIQKAIIDLLTPSTTQRKEEVPASLSQSPSSKLQKVEANTQTEIRIIRPPIVLTHDLSPSQLLHASPSHLRSNQPTAEAAGMSLIWAAFLNNPSQPFPPVLSSIPIHAPVANLREPFITNLGDFQDWNSRWNVRATREVDAVDDVIASFPTEGIAVTIQFEKIASAVAQVCKLIREDEHCAFRDLQHVRARDTPKTEDPWTLFRSSFLSRCCPGRANCLTNVSVQILASHYKNRSQNREEMRTDLLHEMLSPVVLFIRIFADITSFISFCETHALSHNSITDSNIVLHHAALDKTEPFRDILGFGQTPRSANIAEEATGKKREDAGMIRAKIRSVPTMRSTKQKLFRKLPDTSGREDRSLCPPDLSILFSTSPRYVPPEVEQFESLSGRSDHFNIHSSSIDIYALGVVMEDFLGSLFGNNSELHLDVSSPRTPAGQRILRKERMTYNNILGEEEAEAELRQFFYGQYREKRPSNSSPPSSKRMRYNPVPISESTGSTSSVVSALSISAKRRLVHSYSTVSTGLLSLDVPPDQLTNLRTTPFYRISYGLVLLHDSEGVLSNSTKRNEEYDTSEDWWKYRLTETKERHTDLQRFVDPFVFASLLLHSQGYEMNNQRARDVHFIIKSSAECSKITRDVVSQLCTLIRRCCSDDAKSRPDAGFVLHSLQTMDVNLQRLMSDGSGDSSNQDF